MKKTIFLCAIGFCFHYMGYAQVIITDLEPNNVNSLNTKAALKIISEKSGVLIPKLSEIRVEEKSKNHTGELFFSEKHNCLMINVAEESALAPKWECISNEPEAIPKS